MYNMFTSFILYIYLQIFYSSGSAVSRAVSCRLPTAEAGVQPRISLWEVRGGSIANGTGLPMSTLFSPVSITTLLHIHLNLNSALIRTKHFLFLENKGIR